MTQERLLYYITCSRFENAWYHDEANFIEALTKRGITVQQYVWTSNEPIIAGSLAIIRTPWDYHLNSSRFLEWLRQTSLRITILNDYETVKQNTNKGYLKILRDAGMPIVPTEFIAKGSPVKAITETQTRLGWEDAVFKPAVGASAYGLCRLTKGKSFNKKSRTLCENLLKENDGLLQAFQASVCTKGELSLVFFEHVYSHAVVKRPKGDKYTVQGGTREKYEPSKVCKEVALRALETLAGDKRLLYARIDILFGAHEDEYLITEVEFIEPELFFRSAPEASIKLLVNTICERIDILRAASSVDTSTIDCTATVNLKRDSEVTSTRNSKKIKTAS